MRESYAVVDRPGYFGDNRAEVLSVHHTLALAVRASRRHRYTDECGQVRNPTCVILAHGGRGGIIWGDMFPEVLA